MFVVAGKQADAEESRPSGTTPSYEEVSAPNVTDPFLAVRKQGGFGPCPVALPLSYVGTVARAGGGIRTHAHKL